MEPCPYRQGEAARATENAHNKLKPQWSPALIGRESRASLYTPGSPSSAAMEPCPYRQGEAGPEWDGHDRETPQWSPALIGRESWIGGT